VTTRRSRASARAALAVALLAGAGLGACGGDGESEGTPALTSGQPLGEGGTLVWAVADPVRTIDPLVADTRAEQLVTRQIHEPLVESLASPFGDTRRVPGLARRVSSSRDATLWTLRLRKGVRFRDGEPFNADAVVANAERWQAAASGRALLPDLIDVFAPRFDVVRFILGRPDRRFDQRLAAPQLGIVSPGALRTMSAGEVAIARGLATGTGPFELRERSRDRQLLARNTEWWGTSAGVELGPALEQIEFRTEPSSALRLALLDAGDVQLADELAASQARQARADALLYALRGAGGLWLGLSRAVRGVDSAREIPSLSGAWLATVTVAE
jgi:peptide/nickel transport system substrate-binding protein